LARIGSKKTNDSIIEFEDSLYGLISQRLESDIGDFILRRSDGIYAYQLAVVIDDCAQGITHVVRGADLLDSTPRQIYLQKLLGYSTPMYTHLPVALNKHGKKLSKQISAAPLNLSNRQEGQSVPHPQPQQLQRKGRAFLYQYVLSFSPSPDS